MEGFNSVDAGAESHEHSEGGQLTFHSRRRKPVVVASLHSKAVDITTREFVQVPNFLLFAPLDELFEAVVVGLESSLGDLMATVVKIHFLRCARIDGFEIVRQGVAPRSPE